ncbi:hypothetical protein GCM10010503_54680 [Streptomyces lucensis JCM 4490]|uniref:Uncharacterized protein n=1 Tax=Streptomyces lucensis JCM 4490 TaxID=1306176 RepID=A0A918MU13_9ACTN|nr:hypothetical protein GCM10010503_54680 [Streptomyces lucensis JCM 4490]
MQQRGAHDPQRDPEPVAGEQPYARVRGECEGAAEQQQVERTAEGRRAASHHRSPKVSRDTHLVLSTPGAAGTMIRAG